MTRENVDIGSQVKTSSMLCQRRSFQQEAAVQVWNATRDTSKKRSMRTLANAKVKRSSHPSLAASEKRTSFSFSLLTRSIIHQMRHRAELEFSMNERTSKDQRFLRKDQITAMTRSVRRQIHHFTCMMLTAYLSNPGK